jgi:hypothetical protein
MVVIERVDERIPMFCDLSLTYHLPLDSRARDDLCTIPGRGFPLDGRGIIGHDDGGLDAQKAGG